MEDIKAIKAVKEKLYDHCLEYSLNRLNLINDAIKSARESGNDENKSSAGDKHETGRSMAQLEQEKLSFQLIEAQKLLQLLNSIERGKISSLVSLGTLVITDNGSYFISISAGKLLIDSEQFFPVSPASPIGSALLKTNGNMSFVFNNKKYIIKRTY
jgi:hypothetical protein